MKWDAILYVDNQINEADERIIGRKQINGTTKFNKGSIDWDDPRLWTAHSFGSTLRTILNGMGTGFSSEITDFGKWISVRVTYHDQITGRSSSKTFLIIFKQKGDGIVMSTHNRYRTISGVDQAGSYIRATCSSLQSSSQSKIG
jgi:hypothetical protein